MLLARRIATGIVIAAALAVLVLSVYLLWNTRQWDYLPLHTSYTSDLDARAQLFEDKLEIYTRRVNDMESLVILLLGITGLYTIVFILTADFNARTTNRRVDRAMAGVRHQIGMSMGDLRELKEETRDALRTEAKKAAERLDQVEQRAREILRNMRADAPNGGVNVDEVGRSLAVTEERIAALARTRASDEQKQEIIHFECSLGAIELMHARQLAPQLAKVYRALAQFYEARDATRSRFYLGRSRAMAPESFETANELGMMALDSQPPDYAESKRQFEASLTIQPKQQRAKYGLARIARAEGNLSLAQALLESALQCEAWESAPDPANTAMLHYALACVLARRAGDDKTVSQAEFYLRATQELHVAFNNPSRKLEQMLSRDIEEGGDLFTLANTLPYGNVIDDVLLNVKVGAA